MTVLHIGTTMAILTWIFAPLPLAAQDTGSRSTTSGFTVSQAERGERMFAEACAVCHVSQEFAGRLFQINWSGKSLGELYAFIRDTMPFDAPGRLTDHQYADLTAYILKLNRYPAGSKELPSDLEALSSIVLEFQ